MFVSSSFHPTSRHHGHQQVSCTSLGWWQTLPLTPECMFILPFTSVLFRTRSLTKSAKHTATFTAVKNTRTRLKAWVGAKSWPRWAKDPKPEGSRSALAARLCNREKARHVDVIGRLGVEIIIEPAPRCSDIRAHGGALPSPATQIRSTRK